MKYLDDSDLMQVTGGAARVASSRRDDQALELALTRLQSDLRDLGRPQQNNATQMMAMVAMAVAARRA